MFFTFRFLCLEIIYSLLLNFQEIFSFLSEIVEHHAKVLEFQIYSASFAYVQSSQKHRTPNSMLSDCKWQSFRTSDLKLL